MIFKVFLDTNIYDAMNYSFHNAAFQELRNRSVDKEVQLTLNSVIEGEVRSHISERITKSVEKLNRDLKDGSFAGLKSLQQFKNILAQKEAKEYVEISLKEFDAFLLDCKAENLPIDSAVSVSKILRDYFEQNPPFETKKPDEFKDAIAIESLLSDMHKEIEVAIQWIETDAEDFLYCVVSNDDGFCKAVQRDLSEKELEYVKFFKDLYQFVDFLAGLDKQSEYTKQYLCSEYGAEVIEDAIREAVNAACLEIDLDGLQDVEEQDIIETDIKNYTVYVLGINKYADSSTIAKIVVKSDVLLKVWYKYMDAENSFWDKEEHEYLWKETGEVEATYQIKPEIVISLDISGCIAPEAWEPGVKADYSDAEVEFNDFIETLERIDCEEDNLIEVEVLEHSDPFSDYEEDDEVYQDVATNICPDCGRPIGFQNDGGNGFCVNCAPNH